VVSAARSVTDDPRTTALVVLGALSVMLMALVSMVPLPYAMVRPGPVRDVLSSPDGKPLIEVKGHPTYPTSGTLDLLTVRITGAPDAASTVWDLLDGWADPDVDIRPASEFFETGVTQKEVDEENAREMETSQEASTAAAMAELGTPVPTTLTVNGFSDDSGARGHLASGDVITAVNGVDVVDMPALRAELAKAVAGDSVTVTVVRDGVSVSEPVVTTAGDDGRALLGVLIDPTYHFPYQVTIRIDDIGGPSAGMMFALGIIDVVTPGELTGGELIAGTGTISSDGTVGAIGGIRQKMAAAAEAGNAWFLAPAGNCPDITQVPDGLHLVKVSTLHEARQAVEAIGSADRARIAALPGC
jgi:PDZ domain-containing protein